MRHSVSGVFFTGMCSTGTGNVLGLTHSDLARGSQPEVEALRASSKGFSFVDNCLMMLFAIRLGDLRSQGRKIFFNASEECRDLGILCGLWEDGQFLHR